MAHLELVRCRLAIQYCIGHFSDGRERHRTFSLQNIRPDASADALASVVRAVAPLLRHPITKVRIVKKYVLVSEAADVRPMSEIFPNAHDAENSGERPRARQDFQRRDSFRYAYGESRGLYAFKTRAPYPNGRSRPRVRRRIPVCQSR
jgi:hypothetical protein